MLPGKLTEIVQKKFLYFYLYVFISNNENVSAEI